MARTTVYFVIALLLVTWLGSVFLPIWLPLGSSKRFLRLLLSDGAVSANYGGTDWPQSRLDESTNKWLAGIRREEQFSWWGFEGEVIYHTPTLVWPDGKLQTTGHHIEYRVQTPAWIWILLLTYPAIVLIRGPLRRRRRRKRGLCLQCGYNLTGNTTGVCPECSQKIEGDDG